MTVNSTMRGRLNAAIYGAERSPIREFSRLAAQTPGCIRLTLGEPDFDTPEQICMAASEAFENGETHYIENNGLPELREEIARFERYEKNLNYSPDEIIVTIGATEALFVALFGILNPCDEVIVPIPGFVLYERIIGLCRGNFVPLDTREDGFQINAEKLSALVTTRTKAIILNSPNNPTGCIYNEESLSAVRDAVKGRGIFVICDDVYRGLCYSKYYHSFAEFHDMKEQTLVVQSFSKPYAMTGWRVGYLMADYAIKERLELLHQFMVTSSPAPFQRACISALSCDVAVEKMVSTYHKRRDYALERLNSMSLDVNKPEGAFYVFPSIAKFGINSNDFCTRLLLEDKLAVTPGFCFGADDYVRISYCCDDNVLSEGMNRLERFIGRL